MRRSAVRRRVFWGGSSAAYVGSSGVSGGTGNGRTFVSKDATRGIRQDGYVRQFQFRVISGNGGALHKIKFKVMRPNGSSFDVMAESDLYAVGSPGAKTIDLSVPLGPFRQGDRIGVYLTPTGFSIASNAGSSVSGVEADAVGAETYTDYPNVDLLVSAWGQSPIFAVDGDSIPEGHNLGDGNHWHGHMHGGPTGNRDAEFFNLVAQGIPGVDYQNFAVGSSTWAQVRSRASAVAALQPGAVLLSCGVNDVAQGRTWSQVQADMYAYLLAMPAETQIFLCEMIPYSGGSAQSDALSATIRQWNGYYSAWCDINAATLIPVWDAMGQLRASTGFKDDLIPAYNIGDGHLTLAGVQAMAGLIQPVIEQALASQ
jgi:lysophospholipase L1-like esterase